MPSGLVTLDGAYGRKVSLTPAAAEAYKAMIAAARADGIPLPLLGIVSAWRSMAEQTELWEKSDKSGVWVARPGYSPHQTGRAVDLILSTDGNPTDKNRKEFLANTDAYRWLVANAQRFGWYPYKREPWHWEHGRPHDASDANLDKIRAEVDAIEPPSGWLDRVQRALNRSGAILDRDEQERDESLRRGVEQLKRAPGKVADKAEGAVTEAKKAVVTALDDIFPLWAKVATGAVIGAGLVIALKE